MLTDRGARGVILQFIQMLPVAVIVIVVVAVVVVGLLLH